MKHGSRRDMRKLHVTWQFFETRALRVTFSRKQQTRLQIWSTRVCVPNFRSVLCFVWSGGPVQTNIYTSILKKTHSTFVTWIFIFIKLKLINFQIKIELRLLSTVNIDKGLPYIRIIHNLKNTGWVKTLSPCLAETRNVCCEL